MSISKARGEPIPLEDGSELWVTAHPSYLLRLDGPAKEEQERLFAADPRPRWPSGWRNWPRDHVSDRHCEERSDAAIQSRIA